MVVVGADIAWRPLLREVSERYGAQVVSVDLQDPGTVTRRGLLNQVLKGLGSRHQVPDGPGDLAEFDRIISTMPLPVRIALSHFDLAAHRRDYDVDLFSTLRWMIMETRKLVLLAQSRTPFAALLPSDHPLSAIDIATVVLK
jgi:hypothetical protein